MMLRHLQARHLVASAVIVPVAMLFGTGTAYAAGNTTVAYTSEGGSTYGGKGIAFGKASPEAFKVCDTEKDGHSVKAIFKWDGGSASIRDMDGSTAFCDNKPEHIERHNVPEGKDIYITVCLYEKSNGQQWACGYGLGKA